MPPLAARCGQAIAGAGASAAARRQLLRGPVVSRQRATNVVAMAAAPATTVKLQAVKLTPEAFAPFGQVVGPSDDGKMFDQEDAQLSLSNGTPRFYIMRLPKRGLRFHRITYHQQCTQCLGGLNPPGRWFMAVAAPSGSVAAFPRPDDLTVFEVPHGVFIKMHAGTWHAGPLFFESDEMDFYNLELSDTNVVDHNTHDYMRDSNMELEVLPVA